MKVKYILLLSFAITQLIMITASYFSESDFKRTLIILFLFQSAVFICISLMLIPFIGELIKKEEVRG